MPELAALFRARGGEPAILALGDGGVDRWTYAELAETIARLAGGLVRAGVVPGEPVALWYANCPAWVAIFFAVVGAGAAVVLIDNAVADGDLAHILANSGARRVFAGRANLERLRAIAGGGIEVYLVDADGDVPGATGWRRVQGNDTAPPTVPPEALAAILYTSGTMGAPKGVPLSHRNLMANLAALLREPLAHPGDRVLLPLPLHHAYALTVGMLGTLASGATLVLPAGISGPQIVGALRASDAGVMIGVPRLYEALLAGIEARLAGRGDTAARVGRRWLLAASVWLRRSCGLRLGRLLFFRLHRKFGRRLRLLGSGGARLEPAVAWKLEGLGWRVLSGYGLTETAPILTFNPPRRNRIGSEGLPVPGVELRIDAPPGSAEGEILARGPSVFAGYWRDEAATREAFAEGGWFRTGDLGRFDRDGHLYVVGRRKEIIVRPDGTKVFPERLEATYGRVPYIREMAVIDHEGTLKGLIVPDYDAIRVRGAIGLEKLLRDEIEHLGLRLPSHQRLSGYAVVKGPLPRTQLGKLRRHLLGDLYRQAGRQGASVAPELSEADRALIAQPAARALWNWLGERFADKRLTLDTSPQLDLGVDSLEWVSLTLQLEDRLRLRLTEAAIARVVTLRDLLREAVAAEEPIAAAAGDAVVGERLTFEPARWLARPEALLTLFALVVYGLNWLLMHGLFRLRVVGSEHVPRDRACVIASNHASYLDPFALAAALPWRRLRHTYWAGWAGKLFSGRAISLFSRATHVIPVDPDRRPAASLSLAAATLERGEALIWFPEGRRSPTGDILPFEPGVGPLLERTGVETVPVFISGTFEALPRFRRFPRLRPLRVTFGKPLAPAALSAAGRGETAALRSADALHAAVAALAKGTR